VTWQAVTLGILAAVLVGGFAWYERSRPPSRIVALVAALAALAVAARLVFAPIPNVLATTDIVLFTGYAVGGGPGFVVGALTALVSNFWLGQGPWTPWQMAGWGLVGVGGAALAAATGRRLGRFGLAAACGVAGLAYGALLDLSVMVTYGGEQSLDRYLAISARGIPFNVAHAAGNVAFALVAGPALVRMLLRFRARCEFRWRRTLEPTAACALAALAIGAGGLLGVVAGPRDASATEARAAGAAGEARAWLQDAQNDDGGFGTVPGGSSSAAMTGWATLGLETSGRNPLELGRARTPIDYLRAKAGDVRSTGDLERTILALAGAGVGGRDFAGRDLVAALRARRAGDGSFQGQVNLTAFGIFALRATGAEGSELNRSARWLRRAQNGDGGWGYQPEQPSEGDSTGAALQALAAAGGGGDAASDGARYLDRSQGRDGGWALAESGPTNSQSTAWAIQGLLAAGRNPASVTRSGHSPFDYLDARQASDGHYRYSAASDQTPVWVTSQVLIAVNRETFPIEPVARAPAGGGGEGGGGGGDEGGGTAAGAGGGKNAVDRKAGGAKGDAAGPSSGVDTARDSSSAPEPAGPPAFEQTSAEDDGPSTQQIVLGGLGLLAVLLVGGFFLYQRRLPG
jgi:energy-coupling factor transport system substrate-specific component